MGPSYPDQAFVEHLLELMSGVGAVHARRMFGGHGLFLHGLMFALVAEGLLYLKVDPRTQEMFAARGLEPFTYLKRGKPCQLSYYQSPEETLESAEEMQKWVMLAYASAQRAASKA